MMRYRSAWTALIVAAIAGYATSATAQENPEYTDTIASISISSSEALTDYREWVSNIDNIKIPVMREGIEWSDLIQAWYEQAVAPAVSESAGDWEVIHIRAPRDGFSTLKRCWDILREEYFKHVTERVDAVQTEATRDLVAEMDAAKKQREELFTKRNAYRSQVDLDFLKGRMDTSKEIQMDLDLELAGLKARLESIRERLEQEEVAMNKAVAEREAYSSIQREAIEKGVELAEKTLQLTQQRFEVGVASNADLGEAEMRLVEAQARLIALESDARHVEPTPVYNRLREMLVETEITLAEVSARRIASDEQFAEAKHQIAEYEEIDEQTDQLGEKIDSLNHRINEVRDEVGRPIWEAYRY